MNYEEAMNFIQNTSKFGSVLGLDNIKELLERLGNPQDQLKVVHIAGTNGKGSTLAFLAGIFRESGYRAGRYVSPASFCYEERFRINEENISKEDLCFYMEKIKKISEEETQGMITYLKIHSPSPLERSSRTQRPEINMKLLFRTRFRAPYPAPESTLRVAVPAVLKLSTRRTELK